MSLFKKLIEKLKSIVVDNLVVEQDINTESDDREQLLMHMIYREGESDADYEIEHDDYKEAPLLKLDVVDGQPLKEVNQKCTTELKKAEEIINKELNF